MVEFHQNMSKMYHHHQLVTNDKVARHQSKITEKSNIALTEMSRLVE